MVRTSNSGIIDRQRIDAGIQLGTGNVATELNINSIQPVLIVNPTQYNTFIKFNDSNNATNTTIFTTSTTRDTYLTAFTLSVIKDVTSTSTGSSIGVIIDGAVILICKISSITLTIQNATISLSLPYPIKVDKGSIVSVRNATGNANIYTSACIFGYEV